MKNLKSKRAMTTWLRSQFDNKVEFADFLDYVGLRSFVDKGETLTEYYMNKFNQSHNYYKALYNSLSDLPMFEVKYKNTSWYDTPLGYISWRYGSDELERNKLFNI